jgi:hypothetical protein
MPQLLDRKTFLKAAAIGDRIENLEERTAEILELVKAVVAVVDPRQGRRGPLLKRFTTWCDEEEMLPRLGYALIKAGEVDSIIQAERTRYIVLDSWEAYVAREVARQKAAPRPTVNPPPRRGAARDMGKTKDRSQESGANDAAEP